MNIDTARFKTLDPGERILLGPGPSNVPARVLQAMASPCIGHLDPAFLSIMDETQELLRFLFQTGNALTIPVSGTGSSGMETCFVNLMEPGDTAVICVNGVFGTRMADVAGRLGAQVIPVEGQWGRAVDPDRVRRAVIGRRIKVIAAVHAETSTGVCQPLSDLSAIAHEAGALFIVDTVTSLGGMEVAIDSMGIDAAYSGTQKCISCPPGLSPVTFGPLAMEVLEKRKSLVPSWYLDMSMVKNYWGQDRKYHHTAPVNMIYALRESLRIIAEEGLEARFERHRLHHTALVAGVETMGLSMLVPQSERLPMLNSIIIPDGIDDGKVRKALLNDFGLEIGGGLGVLAGKIWRVGLMGHACNKKNLFLFLTALHDVLSRQGFKAGSDAISAASSLYSTKGEK